MIIQGLHCSTVKAPTWSDRETCQGSNATAAARRAGRTFLLEYVYAGQSPEVQQQIVDMAMNASGIRDTARVLHIRPHTVLAELKKGL